MIFGRKNSLVGLFLSVGLVALMFSPRVALSQVTWPMFQHDPQHTGRSDLVVGPQTNTVRCQFPLGATGFTVGSPAVADDGTIYVTSGNFIAATGSLFAINPDCTQKWVFPLPGSPASTAPAVAADGTIYVHANGSSNILAVETLTAVTPDATFGTLRWQFKFNGGGPSFTSPVQSSPAVAPDGTIWVSSMDTNLYGLNPDGTIQCAVSPTGSSMTSSPAIGPDGTVYVVDATSQLHAFTPSCLLMWSTQLSPGLTPNDQSPSVAVDGTIYVGAQDGNLHALNSDGSIRWSFPTGFRIRSTPALAQDGTIYVASDFLYALNPDRTLQWKFPSSTVLFSSASPVIDANGTIYWRVAFTLFAINPDGTEKWRRPMAPANSSDLDSSAALVGDGVLAVGDGGVFDPATLLIFAGPQGPPTIGKSFGAATIPH